jgi:peptidoglycan/LPS O-acetylase OafA/YrhL
MNSVKYIRVLIYCKQIIFAIFELNPNTHTLAPPISRFEFLDGYRGSLAIVVAISHTFRKGTCELFNSTVGYSLTYGIGGFFMLSAFLLTYRLLEDLNKTSIQPQAILLHVSKYFIRRLFRIYFVYVIFILALKYGPRWISAHEALKYDTGFKQMVTLGNVGKNHLWTIPSEIKYYFFIPIFCLVCRLLGRYVHLFWVLCIIWTIYDQVFFNLNK